MGRRGRAGRRPGGRLELVQGAGITDLIPRYNQSVGELDRAIRETAVARLEAEGLNLGAVGSQYYATALAVTGRERVSLSADEREALGKATSALGWRAPEIALLCVSEIGSDVDAEPEQAGRRGRRPLHINASQPQHRPLHINASQPQHRPLHIDASLTGKDPVGRVDSTRHRPEPQSLEPILAAYARALNAEAVILLERDLLDEPPRIDWVKIAVCDDFFGSLSDQNKKRAAWIQLQAARKTSALAD